MLLSLGWKKFNDAVTKTLKLAEELEGYKREAIIREASRDLADTQVEKLASLAEDIDFVDEDTFASKVATIKESYFTKKATPSLSEETLEESADDTVEVSGSMAQYLDAIRRQNKN